MAFHTEYRCVEKMALGSGNLPFPLKGKGEGSNQKGSNQPKNRTITTARFLGGGPERGNPAMTAKRLRQGVKETLNINVVGKTRGVFLFY